MSLECQRSRGDWLFRRHMALSGTVWGYRVNTITHMLSWLFLVTTLLQRPNAQTIIHSIRKRWGAYRYGPGLVQACLRPTQDGFQRSKHTRGNAHTRCRPACIGSRLRIQAGLTHAETPLEGVTLIRARSMLPRDTKFRVHAQARYVLISTKARRKTPSSFFHPCFYASDQTIL